MTPHPPPSQKRMRGEGGEGGEGEGVMGVSGVTGVSGVAEVSGMTGVSEVTGVVMLTRGVSTIRLGMLESSGFRKYSTLLVIQLFSPRLCLCHCLCIRLCLCICVPYSFLNSYYHKLSENVWVWGSRGSRSGDLVGCYHSGTNDDEQKGKIELLSHWTMEG